MSRKDKLLERLESQPKDFTWAEAKTLMGKCGFKLLKGKGSRRKFYNEDKALLISLHEPHPNNILKAYIINDLIALLKDANEFKEKK